VTGRPRRLVVVVGTATEVGKTWVSAALLRSLGGRRVAARKPAQSFDPDDPGPTDAVVLASASDEQPGDVCPQHRSYPVAMAPPMAADVLGLAVPDLRTVLEELRWPDDVDVGLVETVGGVRSPLAGDADSRDLADALQPDVVLLVADAGLGVIDSVRSAVDALARHEVVVFLNRFAADDDLHQRNARWLADRDGFTVVTRIDELARRVVG
jgi:dethiobiotin synthetase